MLEMSQTNCNTILTQPTLANLSGAQCSQSKSSFGDYSRTKIRKKKIQYNIYALKKLVSIVRYLFTNSLLAL